MPEKPDSKKEVVTFQELEENNLLQIKAVLRILAKKKVITKQEYIEEMKQLIKEIRERSKVSN